MLFPGRLPAIDEDSQEADKSSEEYYFPANLFLLGPAVPGDHPFIDESDSDKDMPPLTSVSDSSESDKDSETESEGDKDGIPGRGVFQLQTLDSVAGKKDGETRTDSSSLSVGMCQDIFNYSMQLMSHQFKLVLGSPVDMTSMPSPLLFQLPTPMPDCQYC